MKGAKARERLEEAVKEMGLPPHVCGVVRKPASYILTVAIGSRVVRVEAPSGINENDLEFRIGQLRGHWEQHKAGQLDIEDVEINRF